MRELYENLYRSCRDLGGFAEASHFVGIKGEPQTDVRLMLVGRACNGWEDDTLRNLSLEEYSRKAEEEWNSPRRWDWIEDRGGSLYSLHDSSYCVSRSPFWDYSKSIWERLTGKSGDGIWMRDILWTNLYKISPPRTGNPDEGYINAEKGACIDILREEIRSFSPTHMLFITGFDWFKDFSGIFDEYSQTGRNISRGKNKNPVYAEGTARMGEARAVIMCRPEYRDKDAYVADAVRAFSPM